MVESILSIEQSDRPKAVTVSIHMQRTTLAQQAAIIRQRFQNILALPHHTIHLAMEYHRFRGWQTANRLDVPPGQMWPPPSDAVERPLQIFHKQVEQLTRIVDAIGPPGNEKHDIRLQALRMS